MFPKIGEKDKTEENPLFLLFTSMIVKDSVNIAGNQIEFELRNKFLRPLYRRIFN